MCIRDSHYTVQQVRTESADLANTVLKMACKRAKIAMVLNVTAASDMFGQDLEDLDAALREFARDDRETGEVIAQQVYFENRRRCRALAAIRDAMLLPDDVWDEETEALGTRMDGMKHSDLKRAIGKHGGTAVSYTHLTLPTNREV